MPINIAIDGPAGAGKSTVARTAAERLLSITSQPLSVTLLTRAYIR